MNRSPIANAKAAARAQAQVAPPPPPTESTFAPSRTLQVEIMGQAFSFTEIDREVAFDLSWKLKGVRDAFIAALMRGHEQRTKAAEAAGELGEDAAAVSAVNPGRAVEQLVENLELSAGFCRELPPELSKELRSHIFAKATVDGHSMAYALRAGLLKGGVHQAQLAFVHGLGNSFGPFGMEATGEFALALLRGLGGFGGAGQSGGSSSAG